MERELVFIGEGNQAITNSLSVADSFEKNHSDVVRAIDNLLCRAEGSDYQCDAKMLTHKMFVSYSDDIPQPNGGMKSAKRYIMNRDGFTLLAMGFTGEKALKFKLEYIAAFNKMEEKIKNGVLPTTYLDALKALVASEEEKQILLISNEEMKPKAEFFDAVADSKDAIDMGCLSKVLGVKGMGRNNLFEFLRENKILMNNNTPFQRYQDMGLFRVVEQHFMKNGEPCVNIKTLVYQKGVNYIRKLLKERE